MMMKEIDMKFPVQLVGLVFFSVITFTCLANAALTTKLAVINRQVGQGINSARFPLMDTLSPHFGNFYFWIPFYCCLVLLLIGLDRVKFFRNCVFLGAYLVIAGLSAYGLNSIGTKIFSCNQFHYNYSAIVSVDCSFVCLKTTLFFGAAIFVSLYLDKRFTVIKVLMLIFALIFIYNLIYLGDDLPVTVLLGMGTGLISAIVCRTWFKRLGAESTVKKLYRNEH
ncbi:hypothetical protein CKK33_18230 [Mucilaginibacter sp. MD40]|nr:hypothetical protein CKK33_18230 [Mucilaginibacter sp. MD40]